MCSFYILSSSQQEGFYEMRNQDWFALFAQCRPWGILTSVDVLSCDPNKIRSRQEIEVYVYALCHLIEMKRFGECQIVHFGEDERVAGYSMTQLIETSLISGHFANASNSAYIDVFSCKYYDPQTVASFTAEFFGSTDYDYNVALRGKQEPLIRRA